MRISSISGMYALNLPKFTWIFLTIIIKNKKSAALEIFNFQRRSYPLELISLSPINLSAQWAPGNITGVWRMIIEGYGEKKPSISSRKVMDAAPGISVEK